ncbi:hypothetical protein GOBAR_AA01629 [Gossypium barbadense]|uniref:Uncharacterized protein n=1 Tax=Gossypium barbadense TaxID=3634 RepID=A0A2P5YTS3_GOSBA|nr:hypothetical protein GOBAR_AA01629 [Gossypium barbadense]
MAAGTQQEYEELKQEVRRMLEANMDKSSQKLHIIDAVQRLGVAYHFEKEIEEALEIIYRHHCNHIEIDGDDLYTTAVRFRLLREHGFDVHCETFNKFKDKKGNFKESLIGDVKGMLELYEAAHFQLHGENILEEALSFTTFHLKLAETTVDYPLSAQIANALKRPLRKSVPRPNFWGDIFLSSTSEMWWKGLDVATNFPFVRDRLVECYFWMMGAYFELHYAVARAFVTKMKRQSQVYFVEAKESITKETFNWAFNDPKIIRALSIFCRLMNDIVGHKVEQERGHVSSAVECYKKQYGVSMQEAYDELYKQINNAWKDINEEFLKPTAAPTSAFNRILNLARVIDHLYTGEDAYTEVGESVTCCRYDVKNK